MSPLLFGLLSLLHPFPLSLGKLIIIPQAIIIFVFIIWFWFWFRIRPITPLVRYKSKLF
uniref:Uncharacterized protein n=1 Tax=Arundo donax TaxID=35708 RepID=A0A0A9H7P4_ARUDO